MNKLTNKYVIFEVQWWDPHYKNGFFTVVFFTEHASYVTKLTDLIKSKSSPDQSDVDNSANFVGFFPIFVWTLRDFALVLEEDGKSITPDEYLESSLALRKGKWEQWKFRISW